jgi:cyclophilin family peptidyl-prolyl cis-trans isomerase
MLLNNIKIELCLKKKPAKRILFNLISLQKKFDSLTTVELETMIKYSRNSREIYKTGGEPRLDQNYDFGEVIKGIDVVDSIAKFKQIKKINLLMIFV